MNYILYFITGTKYACRLLVSLASLRKHHPDIPVVIMGPEPVGESVASFLVEDRVYYRSFPMKRLRRNSCYYAKTYLHQCAPEGTFLFLDCDTLITGDISGAWSTRMDQVVLTQFANWITTGNRISGRIKKWEKVAPHLVREALALNYPAVNTGVFSGHTSHPFFEEWTKLTEKNIIFICDEIAAQLLFCSKLFTDTPVACLDDRFNCSPRYGHQKDEAVIWHGHGESFQRMAFTPWVQQLRECVDQDYARCRNWLGQHLLPMEQKLMEKEGIWL